MLIETINRLNWLDVFLLIICIRIGYKGIRTGIFVEGFKLLGTLLGLFLALHYYAGLSKGFKAFLSGLPRGWLDSLAFFLLILAGYMVLFLLRIILSFLVKMEAVNLVNKWGSFFVAMARAVFAGSFIVFFLLISGSNYPQESVKNSFSGRYLLKVGYNTYSGIWNSLVSRFMPEEKFNPQLIELKKQEFPD
jgi:uncharacterized membrane protein required for colicin V production